MSRELACTPFAGRIYSRASVGSTNDELRRLAAEGAGDGTVVLADRQTAGRGRRGREWHSASGLGLYISVLFLVPEKTQPITRWTLGAAVAACEACRELTGRGVEVKWPNDLIHRGRKLGGILAETRTMSRRDAELVIGTGINVGHRANDLPGELTERATSLLLLARGSLPPERETVAVAYLRRLADRAAQLREGRWELILRDFERLAPACRGSRVRVVGREAGGAREVVGVTDGLDPDGALRVRDSEGRTTPVRIADSIRLIEG